ncbi:methyltransferase [Echria macrotheca]|uniref:Methyltransferase n=1 Tax=Echria macrotheca TaxID=438768 RepID=A0AAJ0FCY3_9PEZI|nr:methyltransferase [Echria macrotheca]
MSCSIPLSGYEGEQALHWFDPTPGVIPWPARELLEKYAGIPEEDIEKEVISLRNMAWKTFTYPCIGQFEFLELQLSTRTRLYHRVLSRLYSGQYLIDMGCCLGQDLRKLAFDGVLPSHLVGVDLHPEFIELGYDLFRDRDRQPGIKMLVGDIQAPVDAEPWPLLKHGFDIVNFSMILHAFEHDEQAVMLEKAVHVLRDEPGAMMMGTACGSRDGRVSCWSGKDIPLHNAETFTRLVAEVGERTGTRWQVEAEVDNGFSMHDGKRKWVGPHLKRLVFEITRLE